MRAIICDIDGVLADDSKRIQFLIGKKDHSAYYSKIPEDAPFQNIVNLMSVLIETHYLILLTGRPDTYRESTEKWLKDHGVQYDLLLMRKAGDYRSGESVKKEIYMSEIKGKFEITAVFEDLTAIVTMWRSLGLTCWQNMFLEDEKNKLLGKEERDIFEYEEDENGN